ncbi:MAG: hypothetical protein GXP17_08855 [Gammaproteobacteria bacterium]|nr:hypothetical protein [Gammaproteobacteria bacterium]
MEEKCSQAAIVHDKFHIAS